MTTTKGMIQIAVTRFLDDGSQISTVEDIALVELESMDMGQKAAIINDALDSLAKNLVQNYKESGHPGAE